MGAASRIGQWASPKVIALEYGDRFDEWTFHNSSGQWNRVGIVGQERYSIGWKNNNGVATGSAMFRLPFSAFSLPASSPYESQHTVHMRCARRNNVGLHNALGVATALTATSATGYIAIAYSTATLGVTIGKLTAGAVGGLASSAATVVRPGDVLSLAYRYDTTNSRVELAALLNGVVVVSTTNSASPHRMSTLSGRFGLYGDPTQALPNSLGIGHTTPEWWVTSGWQTFAEPDGYFPGMVR